MTIFFSNGTPQTPSGFKVRPHSYASIEKVAAGFRLLLPTIPNKQYRLDCRRVLEITLPKYGYEYHIVKRKDLNKCAAFTIPQKGIIVIREDIYELLLDENVYGRSTVVHESSHIVLDHATTLHRGAVLGEHKFYEDSEWQAKALTAALMMPIEACRQAKKAEDLAEICGTSVQSAQYRLKRLQKDGVIQCDKFC